MEFKPEAAAVQGGSACGHCRVTAHFGDPGNAWTLCPEDIAVFMRPGRVSPSEVPRTSCSEARL